MKIITPDYIRNFKLDENAKYKVLIIHKRDGINAIDKIEPAREILHGQLISQQGYIFLFECINRKNNKKRVCINKIDYLINNKLITKYD
mgnify:FL=1